MATVNYYLKGAVSKERLNKISDRKNQNEILNTPRQIYLMVSVNGRRIQIYTKRRIEQMYWDLSKQEIDCQKYRTKGKEINKWLHALRHSVLDVVTENELSGRQTTKKHLEEILNGRIVEKVCVDSFELQYKEFLDQHKTSNGLTLRPNTIIKYKGLYSHLKNFATKQGLILNMRFFDKQFLSSFKEHLIHGEKHNDNTVAKYIKALKTLLRHYMNKGVTSVFPLSEFKAGEKEGSTFVLTLKEVLTLQHLKLEDQKLQYARDIFCFMCWTGQRFSDYINISHKDFLLNERGEKIWRLITIKTNDLVSVPIIEYADEILNRYNDSPTPLPQMSNQKVNKYLKEIGISAGLNHQVKVLQFFDGKRKEESVPFFEILTTHVARKSFITNSLILGIPERVVKDISGHKDEKSFRRYIYLADSYKNDIMQKVYSKENINKIFAVT